MAIDNSKNYINYCPKEILAYIFSYLDSPSQNEVSCVCKLFYRIINDQRINPCELYIQDQFPSGFGLKFCLAGQINGTTVEMIRVAEEHAERCWSALRNPNDLKKINAWEVKDGVHDLMADRPYVAWTNKGRTKLYLYDYVENKNLMDCNLNIAHVPILSGGRLLTYTEDKTLHLWDCATQTLLFQKKNQDIVSCTSRTPICITMDARYVFFNKQIEPNGEDSILSVLDGKTGRTLAELDGTDALNCWHSRGKLVVTAHVNKWRAGTATVHLWELEPTARSIAVAKVPSLRRQSNEVTDIKIHKSTIFILNKCGYICTWNFKEEGSQPIVKMLETYDDPNQCITNSYAFGRQMKLNQNHILVKHGGNAIATEIYTFRRDNSKNKQGLFNKLFVIPKREEYGWLTIKAFEIIGNRVVVFHTDQSFRVWDYTNPAVPNQKSSPSCCLEKTGWQEIQFADWDQFATVTSSKEETSVTIWQVEPKIEVEEVSMNKKTKLEDRIMTQSCTIS